MVTLPVVSPSGNALVSLAPEDEAAGDHPEAPVLHALVIVEAGGLVLFCHAIAHAMWELPGGAIEADESPREAGARELFEETGIRVDSADLRWGGRAGYLLADGRAAQAALFAITTTRDHAFAANEEMNDFRWIDPALEHDGTSRLDLAIADWVLSRGLRSGDS